MEIFEKANIIRYHRHRISEYEEGATKVLGWREEMSQQKRFQVLSDIGDFNNTTVLDLGCGYGDLKYYLDQKFTPFTYLGIDYMPEFISRANEIYAQCERTHFIVGDFASTTFPETDYVIACGAFGYRSKSKDFHKEMISKFYKISKKAFAFNMLDALTFKETPLLAGQNSSEVFEYCRSLAFKAEMKTGYLKDDFTIFMYK